MMGSRSGQSGLRVHEDEALFRAAVSHTAAKTGFPARLIEKDYFCTLLLSHLPSRGHGLVFEGGTCLAKVHAGFYRLSEDLDFVIPADDHAGRATRSRLVTGLRNSLSCLENDLPVFRVDSPLRGSNNSTQYAAVLGYLAPGRTRPDTIKIEVALREPLLTPAVAGVARTLLRDPVSGERLVPGVDLPCISWPEAMAEKFRAALSRRGVAIRDYYDIDFAVRNLGLQPADPDFIALVERKPRMPRNKAVDVSTRRMDDLRAQLRAQLRPVLRAADLAVFDLERAVAVVTAMAHRVGRD